jgi:transcriptional regulator with XRE-family HTH domain
MNIYLRIKEIAKGKNITQDVIGNALGLTSKTAHNYLNGHTKISVEQLPIIAKVLRVRIDQLFQEVGTPLNINYANDEKLDITEDGCGMCRIKDNEISKLKSELLSTKDKYIFLLENAVPKKENSDASGKKVG